MGYSEQVRNRCTMLLSSRITLRAFGRCSSKPLFQRRAMSEQIFRTQSSPLYPPLDRPLRPSTVPLELPSWALGPIIIMQTQESSTEGNDLVQSLTSGVGHERLTQSIRRLPPYIRCFVNMEQVHTVGLHLGTVAACSENLIYDSKSRSSQIDIPSRYQSV